MDAALRQETFTISIPKVDRRRFKGIVKAMGWNIAPVNRKEKFDVTKTARFKEAMEDVKHGRVTRYDSVDDLFKELLISSMNQDERKDLGQWTISKTIIELGIWG